MSNRAERRREGRQTDRRGGGQKAGPAILNPGISQKRSPVGDLLHAAGPNIASMKPSLPPAPVTMAEAASRLWAIAQEARLRQETDGYLQAAWATIGVQPDHWPAIRAFRWERYAAGLRREWDERAWAVFQERWLLGVWSARYFTGGLSPVLPSAVAREARWADLTDALLRLARAAPRDLWAVSKAAEFLEQTDRFEEALAVVKTGLALTGGQPHSTNHAVFVNARGAILDALGRHAEARRESERLLALLDADPPPGEATSPEAAWRLLFGAQARERLGRYGEALSQAELAVDAAPDNDVARMAAARYNVRCGRIGRGYGHFYRQARPLGEYLGAASERWEGGTLGGRRLRVCSWEGLGDGIQYARWLPLLGRMAALSGGSVLLVCENGSERLLRSLRCDALTVVPWSQHRREHLASVRRGANPDARRPGFEKRWPRRWDLDAALDDLPFLLGDPARPDAVPSPGGYLDAAPEDVERMRGVMADMESGRDGPPNRPLRVGLVWRGSPTHSNDRNRSIPLAAMSPILAVPGVRFFALQKGAAEAEETPDGMDLVRLGPHLRDMADTAAALRLLDILISVDSSPCHLAGALGVPVWTLLPEPSEWRWQVDRLDSPWYSSMTLFRQKEPGDWPELIGRVAAALGELAARRGGRADQEG